MEELAIVQQLKEALAVFITSMLPVAELRVGVPLGVSLGIPWYETLLIAVAGNMVPVPFVIIFMRRIIKWLKSGPLKKAALRLEEHAFKKAEKVYKYSLIGLYILVAIPLPGTGAWTGAIIAALLDIRLKTATPIIFAGVVTAGAAMVLLTSVFHVLV